MSWAKMSYAKMSIPWHPMNAPPRSVHPCPPNPCPPPSNTPLRAWAVCISLNPVEFDSEKRAPAVRRPVCAQCCFCGRASLWMSLSNLPFWVPDSVDTRQSMRLSARGRWVISLSGLEHLAVDIRAQVFALFS